MGFILCVMQDISMYRYLWEPSQATLDPLASSPRQPLAPSEGFPSAYKDPRRVSLWGRRSCYCCSGSSIYFRRADGSTGAVSFLA